MVADQMPSEFFVMGMASAAGDGPTSFWKFSITWLACGAERVKVTRPSGKTVASWLGSL